jgi:transposase
MVQKRRSYSREFKLEAVSMVTEGGVGMAQAARDLGISENSLWRWKKEFEDDPDHAFPGKGHLKPQDDELARLRRENRRLRQERDILKKAVGIFSRVPK